MTFIGRTTFRNERRLFGIKQADRRHHLYVIGKTGTGKSTLLETLISQDLAHGHGLVLLDPHGDLVERVRARVPEERQSEVIYFDVPNVAQALAFNPLERVPALKRPLAAAGVLEAFKKLWADSWGPRLEHILRNALLALFDQPEATLADILRLLDDEAFRRDAARRVANAQVRHFWLREYEHYPARFRAEAIAPIAQLDLQVRDAVLGNIGTLIVFRIGPADAEIIGQEFAPEFAETALVRLPNYHIVVKLMVHGLPSGPFSARTLVPNSTSDTRDRG